MRETIQIRGRTISDQAPLFIVAEVGVTCNYDLNLAKELIEVVRESGADAAKFIFWFPDEIMSDLSVVYNYDTVGGPKQENMYEMLSKLRFTLDQWHELKQYADSRNVILFSTVNSPTGIEWAEAIGLEAFKLSSWDFNYAPLWRRIAAIGKPMLIDTGPVNSAEAARGMQLMKDGGNDQSVLIHCVHTDDYAQMNMRSIPYMRQAFKSLVGYSSKDTSDETDIIAVALGAAVIEKRLTMSRSLPGHHHILSKEPGEFGAYVRLIRNVQAALGECDLRPSAGDLSERRRYFRHVVADCDIPAGTVVTSAMLEGKRPENGVSPEFLEFFVGRRARRDLRRNESVQWEDVS